MRFTIVFLLLSFHITAQIRKNEPLPQFSKRPHSVLKKDVTGWMYSLDGQWTSAKKTIPIQAVSRNKKRYRTRINKLGSDNFEEFRLYPTLYGEDTLILLLKIYTDGYYKYKYTKKGWKSITNVSYYLFNKNALNVLDELKDSIVQKITINILDAGTIKDVQKSDALEAVRRIIAVNEDFDRVFIAMIQPLTVFDRIRFQFYSQHKVFNDVEGVLHDFTINGKSLYHDESLFNYLYYETDIDNFSDFIRLPPGFEFKT